MKLSAKDRALIRRELTAAQQAAAAAFAADDAFDTLTELTIAVEVLTATQSELVNQLLDHGASWSDVADALATSSAAAQRRYPRRAGRDARQIADGSGAASSLGA